MLSWQDTSEIVVGLMLKKRIPYTAIDADDCFSPYNRVVTACKSGVVDVEDLMEEFGFSTIQSCLFAVSTINGQAALDWVAVLKQKKAECRVGMKLEKIAMRLQRGEDIDRKQIKKLLSSLK